MLGYLSADIICSEKQTVFREQSSRKTVQGQISEHIFAPNGGYCLYYPSNLYRNTRNFQNWGIFSDIPQFYLGNIRSRDMLRPIACERKDLMDYKLKYSAIMMSLQQIICRPNIAKQKTKKHTTGTGRVGGRGSGRGGALRGKKMLSVQVGVP